MKEASYNEIESKKKKKKIFNIGQLGMLVATSLMAAVGIGFYTLSQRK